MQVMNVHIKGYTDKAFQKKEEKRNNNLQVLVVLLTIYLM